MYLTVLPDMIAHSWLTEAFKALVLQWGWGSGASLLLNLCSHFVVKGVQVLTLK